MVQTCRDRAKGRRPNDTAKAQQVSGSSQQCGPHLGIRLGLRKTYHVQLKHKSVGAIVCERFTTHHEPVQVPSPGLRLQNHLRTGVKLRQGVNQDIHSLPNGGIEGGTNCGGRHCERKMGVGSRERSGVRKRGVGTRKLWGRGLHVCERLQTGRAAEDDLEFQ